KASPNRQSAHPAHQRGDGLSRGRAAHRAAPGARLTGTASGRPSGAYRRHLPTTWGGEGFSEPTIRPSCASTRRWAIARSRRSSSCTGSSLDRHRFGTPLRRLSAPPPHYVGRRRLLRTDNPPILRINEEMGYRAVAPLIELHR